MNSKKPIIKLNSTTIKLWTKLKATDGAQYITDMFTSDNLEYIVITMPPAEIINRLDGGLKYWNEAVKSEIEDESEDQEYINTFKKNVNKIKKLYDNFRISIIKDFKKAKSQR